VYGKTVQNGFVKPYFQKSCDFEKRADFFVLFLCYTGSMQRTFTRAQDFIPPFTCVPLTYSQGNRVPSFQPDQQGARHPETLDLCGKPTAAERTADRTPCNSDPLLGGVGTTWQELAAGQ
jgi:hypothetical protein